MTALPHFLGFAFLGVLGVLVVSVSMPYHQDAKNTQNDERASLHVQWRSTAA
jgi:putative Mn2+ efflux pump MntP